MEMQEAQQQRLSTVRLVLGDPGLATLRDFELRASAPRAFISFLFYVEAGGSGYDYRDAYGSMGTAIVVDSASANSELILLLSTVPTSVALAGARIVRRVNIVRRDLADTRAHVAEANLRTEISRTLREHIRTESSEQARPELIGEGRTSAFFRAREAVELIKEFEIVDES